MLQRPGGGDLPRQRLRLATRAGATLGPDLCDPDSIWPSASSGSPSSATRPPPRPSCCWTSGSPRAWATSTRARCCGPAACTRSPRWRRIDLETRRGLIETASGLPPGQPRSARPAPRCPAARRAWPSTGATASRATAAARPSRFAATASSPGVTYWCPDCQQRQDPDRAGVGPRRRADARWTSTPPGSDAVRRRCRSTTPATSAARSTPPRSAPALERHPASRRLLDGFATAGPRAQLRRSAARPRGGVARPTGRISGAAAPCGARTSDRSRSRRWRRP